MRYEINFLSVLCILFIHWVADFVFQTDEQARGKSKSWKFLTAHTLTYTACWIPFLYLIKSYYYIEGVNALGLFIPITFICHTVQDYLTSRLNSKLWSEGRTHMFFVSVGFDQFLHFVQLLITFQLVI